MLLKIISVLIITLLLPCVSGRTLRSGARCKVLKPDSPQFELQSTNGFCPFMVVSAQGYYYKRMQVMTFILQTLKRTNKFSLFNFEILNMDGRHAGIMLPNGGNTCSDGALFAHSESHPHNNSVVTMKWRAPNNNAGRLRFRYSVGIKMGSRTLLWYNCTNAGYTTTLKYVREIPNYPGRRGVIQTTAGPRYNPYNTYVSCRRRNSALHTVVRGTNCRRYTIGSENRELTCPGGYGRPRLQFDLRTCSCQFSYLTTCYA